jgi:hypothetical protein
MLGFWGAAATGVLRDHIVQQRYIAYEREMRHAHNRKLRSFKPKGAAGQQATGDEARADANAEWEPFACFHLCVNCGFLAEDGENACPGCRRQNWIDLRNIPMAEQVREAEYRDRQRIPPKIENRGILATLGLAVLGGGVGSALESMSFASSPGSIAIYGVITAVAAAVVGWLIFPRLFNRLYFRRRRRFPSRWRLPLPLPRRSVAPQRTLSGSVRPANELLEAPLSGRRCIGYEVSVLFDVAGDKRPPMWILEEERTASFEIQGERIAAERVTLELPSHLVGGEDFSGEPQGDATGEDKASQEAREDARDKKISRFLRKRGLFISEGDYAVFESLIEPDEHYTVSIYDDPPGAAAVIQPVQTQ